VVTSNLSEDICHQLINQFNLNKKPDIVYRCEHIVIVTTIATCYETWKVQLQMARKTRSGFNKRLTIRINKSID
jgi:hypothetical protein